MGNILLIIHLILALSLIGIVLLQRSEGGGLGMGGGGGAMSGRAAATALARVTWFIAAAFIATSIALTILAAKNAAGDSVIERLGTETTQPAKPATAPLGTDLLPPTPSDAPATPPKAAP